MTHISKPRIGKVKVYNEHGILIREGDARDMDFQPKFFGIFTASEALRGVFAILSIVFCAGFVWSTVNSKFDAINLSIMDLQGNFNSFKTDIKDSNNKLWSAFTDYKKCENQSMVKCCKDVTIC